ncbi:hypothetical protein IAG41_06630 [Sphingomonas sp. JC676]|uniref:hypothetical protein n=1 Tax=Sphingomonas sp. JC676 TaxID=2768065 RepID=UPI001658227C|nr:hypothetical protein [Sphingomonas sp. JC676]MBC9032062.1 hypothetical protein [Sphingomonas sp. JC676]
MLTYRECLARADAMEAYGLTCSIPVQREDYVSVARGWRRVAMLALAQDKYVGSPHMG